MEQRILKVAAEAEAKSRDFLRTFGSERKDSFIGSHLSSKERSHLGALYASRAIKKQKLNIRGMMWEFGILDRSLPLRAHKDMAAGKTERKAYPKRLYAMDLCLDDYYKTLNMQTKETSQHTLWVWYNGIAKEKVTYKTFQRTMKRTKSDGKTRQATPRLYKRHEIERVSFCAEHLGRTNEIFLHLDEKNFMAYEYGKGKVYICEAGMSKAKIKQLTTVPLRSKRHVSWVMFQGVVGKSMPGIGFDGRLYFRRISKRYKAQKDSKYHKKGDYYDKHANYNTEMHLALAKEILQEATVQFKGVVPEGTVIHIQMDGAGPHASETSEKALRRMGNRNLPRVVFWRQIAMSCTLNFLDLAIFNSLGKKAAVVDYKCVDHLVVGVRKAWDQLTPEIIDRVVALQKVTMVEMYNHRGSYISIPSVGLRKSQKVDQAVTEAFTREYIATQLRDF